MQSTRQRLGAARDLSALKAFDVSANLRPRLPPHFTSQLLTGERPEIAVDMHDSERLAVQAHQQQAIALTDLTCAPRRAARHDRSIEIHYTNDGRFQMLKCLHREMATSQLL